MVSHLSAKIWVRNGQNEEGQMDHQSRAKVNETLHEELGDRAFGALGAENASTWNTVWAVESRYIESRIPAASLGAIAA